MNKLVESSGKIIVFLARVVSCSVTIVFASCLFGAIFGLVNGNVTAIKLSMSVGALVGALTYWRLER